MGVDAAVPQPAPPVRAAAAPTAQSPRSQQRITFWDVVRQVKRDVYDKEVQSAATYSYLWLADQMGHIGLGIILTIAFGLAFQLVAVGEELRLVLPVGISLAACAWFEISAYRTYSAQATGLFPRDTNLLRRNALVAFLYMMLGILLGMTWQLALLLHDEDFILPGRTWTWLGIIVTIFCTGVALGTAYYWVRQKMYWQKAGMPFLFRLANMRDTVSPTDADRFTAAAGDYLKARETRNTHTPVVVISGPLTAGKTSFACGIGTEAAFKSLTTRYVTFDKLCQMAICDHDDLGPNNIVYWKWRDSELVIIDDIDSGAQDENFRTLAHFNSAITGCKLSGAFAGRFSVWLIGPKDPPELAKWVDAITSACTGTAADGTATKPDVMTICLLDPKRAASAAPQR